MIRRFTVARRQHQGRFLYRPTLVLAETSGRSRASIKKIEFDLLDVAAAEPVMPIWDAPDVPAGGRLDLTTGKSGHRPWFEIVSGGAVPRLSVAISFVDEAGRGGLVRAAATVDR